MKIPVLLPLGVVLLVLGVFVPRPLSQAAAAMEPGMLRSTALILTDVLSIGFFAGVACVVIGWLRSRKK